MKSYNSIIPGTQWYLNGKFLSEETLEKIAKRKSEEKVLGDVNTIRAFKNFFPDNNVILSTIFRSRLSKTKNKCCPTCNSPIEFYYRRVKEKPAFRCSKCFRKIYPLVGTPLERSHVELSFIWDAMYFLLSSKKGYPAHLFFRHTNLTPMSAWRTLNRIRKWFQIWLNTQAFIPGEVIEIDEVYITIDYIKSKELKLKRGPGSQRKHPVITMTGRTSLVTKMYPILEVSSDTLLEAMELAGINHEHQIKTDEHKIYKCLTDLGFKNHQTCNHKQHQWVTEGATHTNTLEGLHSKAKGTTQRTYEGISRNHIEKYMDEIALIFSVRRKSVIEVFDELLNVLPPLF